MEEVPIIISLGGPNSFQLGVPAGPNLFPKCRNNNVRFYVCYNIVQYCFTCLCYKKKITIKIFLTLIISSPGRCKTSKAVQKHIFKTKVTKKIKKIGGKMSKYAYLASE